MKFFEKVVKASKGVGFVKLVSTDPGTHMNVVVSQKSDDPWSQSAITLTVDKALQIRDALNEVYPPVQTVPEPSDYTVRFSCGEWVVSRVVPDKRTETIAICNNEIAAKKIAQALNEAEGL